MTSAPSGTPGGAFAGLLERDLLLTDADFTRISQLIYQRAGIVLAPHKRDMVYSRLGRRVRSLGLSRFSDYLARLEQQDMAAEWTAFTNALTTNLTSFFREAYHFPMLAQHVSGRRGPVRVWSAAASTGEEAWSIAITLVETLGPQAEVEVLGTDIDTEALRRARAGIYPQELLRDMDQARLKRFFLKGAGQQSGFVRVRPELMARVRFSELNLVAQPWREIEPFDAIFCRNVMIYFDRTTQAKVLNGLAACLKPDGLLFAGHSENFSQISTRFRLRGQTVYTLT